MFYSADHTSPLGPITLASDGENLVGLWLVGQKYCEATIKGTVTKNPDLPVLVSTKKWLDAYFDGKKPAISELPMAPAGATSGKPFGASFVKYPMAGA